MYRQIVKRGLQTKSLKNFDEVLEEVKRLRAENEKLKSQIKNTEKKKRTRKANED